MWKIRLKIDDSSMYVTWCHLLSSVDLHTYTNSAQSFEIMQHVEQDTGTK